MPSCKDGKHCEGGRQDDDREALHWGRYFGPDRMAMNLVVLQNDLGGRQGRRTNPKPDFDSFYQINDLMSCPSTACSL